MGLILHGIPYSLGQLLTLLLQYTFTLNTWMMYNHLLNFKREALAKEPGFWAFSSLR